MARVRSGPTVAEAPEAAGASTSHGRWTLANRSAWRKVARIMRNENLRHRPSAIGHRRRARREHLPAGSLRIRIAIRVKTRKHYPHATR
jgi:hypothetical protein